MFHANQRVQAHPATDSAARGDRFGTIESIGRKWIHVKMDRSRRIVKFPKDADLLMPVAVSRKAPNPPEHIVGRKCWYLTVDGRRVAAVVDSLDSETHPTRLNVRITATKDPRYTRGKLINTPPAFVQAR